MQHLWEQQLVEGSTVVHNRSFWMLCGQTRLNNPPPPLLGKDLVRHGICVPWGHLVHCLAGTVVVRRLV